MGSLDFSLSPVLLNAFFAVPALPLYLLVITRLPGTVGRNALQFLISFLVMVLLWAGASFLWPGAEKLTPPDIIVAIMTLVGAGLFYLEIWGLLSRGYTLGLLLTLLKAGRPLSEEELAHNYRNGEGLSWIMR